MNKNKHEAKELLKKAIIHNNLEIIEKLLENQFVDVNTIFTGYYCRYPLHIAVEYCQLDIIKLLLKHNAKINGQDCHKRTPLHIASMGDSVETVKILIQHNCDINKKDFQDETSLHVAVRCNKIEIVNLLCAVSSNINVQNCFNKTPLHISCTDGRLEITKVLLRYKAIVDITDKNGKTALHYAALHGFENIIKLLVEKFEANIDELSSDNLTYSPLHFAVDEERIEATKILLELNANVNIRSSTGYSPLHLAIENQNTTIVEMLLKQSCKNVNIKTQKGLTPLHIATEKQNLTIVRMLLKHRNIDVNSEDENHIRPIDLCQCKNIFKILILYGAKMDFQKHLEFSELSVKSLKSQYEKVYQDCEMELEKMKKINLNPHCRLFDILLMKPCYVGNYINHTVLKSICESPASKKEFPNYGQLLKIQFKKGLLYNSAHDALTHLSGISIPYLCLPELFKFFEEKDLKNLKESKHMMQKLKST